MEKSVPDIDQWVSNSFSTIVVVDILVVVVCLHLLFFLSSNTPFVNLKMTTWSLLEIEIIEEIFQSCIEFVGQLAVCS